MNVVFFAVSSYKPEIKSCRHLHAIFTKPIQESTEMNVPRIIHAHTTPVKWKALQSDCCFLCKIGLKNKPTHHAVLVCHLYMCEGEVGIL